MGITSRGLSSRSGVGTAIRIQDPDEVFAIDDIEDGEFVKRVGDVLTGAAAGMPAVDSVFSRTGAVVAAVSDYDANQVDFTPDGDIAATNAQAAIAEVRDDTDTKLTGKSNTGHTHPNSELTEVPGDGIDTSAFHDNIGGEIAALTQKTSPTGADHILAENFADSNNKIRVEFTDIPADILSESNTPGNDVSQALRPNGVGKVEWRDVAHSDLTSIGVNDHHAKLHAADHTNGTDDIQNATAAQKGLATATQITKLDGIATGAEVNPDVVSQADAEAGTATDERIWTAQRVKQAIHALAPLDYFDIQADQFESPVSGDRPASIDGLAPTITDSVNAGLQVLALDDTDEEARVWSRRIKPGALTMTLKALWRTATAPGDTVHDIGWKLYWREIPIGVAPSLTWAGTNDGSKTLTEIANIANDILFHETAEVITLASEGILLDREYQFMLSRVAPAGTNLVGDWLMRRLSVELA